MTSDNQVQWSWDLMDHIDFPANAEGDYCHGNSAVVRPEQDEVYFSCRWIGLIKTTYHNPTLIYHLPASQKASGMGNMSFNPSNAQFIDIHDPEVHDDDGTILFFDNGGWTNDMMFSSIENYDFHSRVLEFAVDENAKQATLVWEFPGTINSDSWFQSEFYMPYWGDADRLDNDNVLITASVLGSGTTSHLFEVMRGGEVVWDFTLPTDFGFYRAQRIPTPPLVESL